MHRFMFSLARFMAILGGLVLVSLVVLTCLSVVGRLASGLAHSAMLSDTLPALAEAIKGVGIGPVTGDFELVEAGIAFAIFAFLPWCQLVQGHASVELIANTLSPRANRVLTFAWELVFAAVILLIAWRLFVGMSDKMRYGETTYLLQFPIWWAYLASFFACAVAALTAVYSAYLRYHELASGGSRHSENEGAAR